MQGIAPNNHSRTNSAGYVSAMTSSWPSDVLRYCRHSPAIRERIRDNVGTACICSIQKSEIASLPALAWLQGFLLVSTIIAAGIKPYNLMERAKRKKTSFVYCTFHGGEWEGTPMTGREAVSFLTSNPWSMDLPTDRTIDPDLAFSLLTYCMEELELNPETQLELRLQLADAFAECEPLSNSVWNAMASSPRNPYTREEIAQSWKHWSVIAPVFPPSSGLWRNDTAYSVLDKTLSAVSAERTAESLASLGTNDRHAVVRELTRLHDMAALMPENGPSGAFDTRTMNDLQKRIAATFRALGAASSAENASIPSLQHEPD